MPQKIKHLEGKYKTVTYALIVACEAAELQLYLFLKLHAIDSHSCFPTQRTIQSQLNWSSYKTAAVLDRMEKTGRLKIERGRAHVASVYDITAYDLLNESGFSTAKKSLFKKSGQSSPKKSGQSLFKKSGQNYNNDNNKEITTTDRRGDKSPHRIGSDRPESIADILRRRNKI